MTLDERNAWDDPPVGHDPQCPWPTHEPREHCAPMGEPRNVSCGGGR